MASIRSSPFWNTGTIKLESGWENSVVLMIDYLSFVETDMVKHVIEIESFGMSFDKFDKETGSSDRLSPKQAMLRLRAISSVRRPLNRDSSFKNNVLSNAKNSSKKVEVFDRSNNKSDVASKNVDSNKKIVSNDDIKNALIEKNVLCVCYAKKYLSHVMIIVLRNIN
ncbi:hypothetical protein Tco_0775785 [Tanacetum coccineum]